MHSISHMLRFRDRGGQPYRIEFVTGLDELGDGRGPAGFWHIIREEAVHGDVIVDLDHDPGAILSAANSLQMGAFINGFEKEEWDDVVKVRDDSWADDETTDELPVDEDV